MDRNDPFGDNDPMVRQALEELWQAVGPDTPREKVSAIDGLIQARIVLALEALTESAFSQAHSKAKAE